MKRPRAARRSIAANPVLIGGVTVLIVTVAVFLAYNANNGLPFVPTARVTVTLPDADRLVRGNEVRMGGQRVGTIDRLEPRVDAQGRVTAAATLVLEPGAAELGPKAQVRVRARSPLGLKYLEIVPDATTETVRRLDRRAQGRPVELDDVLDTFDAPTRRSTQRLLEDLGGGLASRGPDLNLALAELPGATRGLARVMRALATPSTDLDGLIVGLSDTAATFSPVGGALRRAIAHSARTLEAVQAARRALADSLAELPRTERVATRAFTTAAPTLSRVARLARALRPATPALRPAAQALADAAIAAPQELRATVPFADALTGRLQDLRRLARRPATNGSIRRLTDTVGVLRDLVPAVTPFQTECNYLGLWFRNVNSATGEGDRNGHWFRFGTVAIPEEQVQRSEPAGTLHANPYPNMVSGDCEAGNEPYLPGRQLGNIPGAQGATELTFRPAGLAR